MSLLCPEASPDDDSPPPNYKPPLPCALTFSAKPALGREPGAPVIEQQLLEMTRLRRKGPINDFVDKDPLKQWVSACGAVCRNCCPFTEKESKPFSFYGGRGVGAFLEISPLGGWGGLFMYRPLSGITELRLVNRFCRFYLIRFDKMHKVTDHSLNTCCILMTDSMRCTRVHAQIGRSVCQTQR